MSGSPSPDKPNEKKLAKKRQSEARFASLAEAIRRSATGVRLVQSPAKKKKKKA